MKLPSFDLSNAQWDKYKAFHISHGPSGYGGSGFVQFDTGELIVTAYKFKPDTRHLYENFNIRVVSTKDRDCPSFTTPDGERCRKAWLSHFGQNVLVLDLDTGFAVRLGYTLINEKRVPLRLRRYATAYFSGPGEQPIGSEIVVYKPYPWTTKEREYAQTMIAASRAWIGLEYGDPETLRKKLTISVMDKRPLSRARMLGRTFTELDMIDRYRLAVNSFEGDYVPHTYDYLLLA